MVQPAPWETTPLTFIAPAHPSLTHSLFALCFIERDESVFPLYCAMGTDSVTIEIYPPNSIQIMIDQTSDLT